MFRNQNRMKYFTPQKDDFCAMNCTEIIFWFVNTI